jgi:hypothetical protein
LIIWISYRADSPHANGLKMILLLWAGLGLANLSCSATAGPITFQEKTQTEHDCPSDGKDHKSIDVGQSRRLRLQAPVDSGEGPHLRPVRAQPGMSQTLAKTV